GDDRTTSFLLPGWQQAAAAGVLVNGVPIGGQMTLIDRDLGSSRITAILGRPIPSTRGYGLLATSCSIVDTAYCTIAVKMTPTSRTRRSTLSMLWTSCRTSSCRDHLPH